MIKTNVQQKPCVVAKPKIFTISLLPEEFADSNPV